MAHLHRVHDTDNHFVIDPITRKISAEGVEKATLVQGDHCSERFTFELPRYIEEHDMAACDRVEVHFTNAAKTGKETSAGVYLVEDLQVSPDDEQRVIFSWLVSREATGIKGTLQFLVCFKCLNGTTIDYEWHSAIFSGIKISGGMDNVPGELEEHSDLIAALEADIDAKVEEKVEAYVAETLSYAEEVAFG